VSRHEEGVRDLAIWDVLVAYVPVSGLSMSGEWLHVVSAASVFPMFGLLNAAVVQHWDVPDAWAIDSWSVCASFTIKLHIRV
jgi:hypothetical protein